MTRKLMVQMSVVQQPVAHPLHHKHHQDAHEQGNRPEWVKEALKKSHGISKIVTKVFLQTLKLSHKNSTRKNQSSKCKQIKGKEEPKEQARVVCSKKLKTDLQKTEQRGESNL